MIDMGHYHGPMPICYVGIDGSRRTRTYYSLGTIKQQWQFYFYLPMDQSISMERVLHRPHAKVRSEGLSMSGDVIALSAVMTVWPKRTSGLCRLENTLILHFYAA